MCGDVMTGRGIDQVLPRPSDPRLYESYVKNATEYVALAQTVSGPFPKRVDFSYPWGDALEELERVMPDLRIINLETAITKSDDFWQRKGINYRMHPKNVPCLKAARIDCCSIANNHVLDWGYAGLAETLAAACAGRGIDNESSLPAPAPAGNKLTLRTRQTAAQSHSAIPLAAGDPITPFSPPH
ncbi:MAG: CapA family protein [Proteobacteria bacterium]|nr:CapA family protein [Pseudomonadota bacterium]